ncbi:MAG TPA: ester cyclase [Gaiellaceae bacterium]|jgi:ketosteroid isomerase-like protein
MSRAVKVAIGVALVGAVVSLARRLGDYSEHGDHGDSEDVLRAYYEAWSSGDADGVRDLLAEGYTGHVHTLSGTDDQDAKTVAARIKSHQSAFDHVEYEVEDVVSRNGEAAARLTMRARHRETGKNAKTTGLSILRIEDGRIAEEWSSWDYHGLAAQLGLE